MKKETVRTTVTLFLIAIFMLLLYVFVGRPMIGFVKDPEALDAFVQSKGTAGLLVFGFFVLIQTMSSCIPGLPFYLASGYLLGGFKGALLCDTFATLGNTAAFLIGKKFGRDFLLYLFPEDKLVHVENIIKKRKAKDHSYFIHATAPSQGYICLAWLLLGRTAYYVDSAHIYRKIPAYFPVYLRRRAAYVQ